VKPVVKAYVNLSGEGRREPPDEGSRKPLVVNVEGNLSGEGPLRAL